jgi:hypothetical protein
VLFLVWLAVLGFGGCCAPVARTAVTVGVETAEGALPPPETQVRCFFLLRGQFVELEPYFTAPATPSGIPASWSYYGEAGVYRVEVSLDGYRTQVRDVRVTDDRCGEVHTRQVIVQLEPDGLALTPASEVGRGVLAGAASDFASQAAISWTSASPPWPARSTRMTTGWPAWGDANVRIDRPLRKPWAAGCAGTRSSRSWSILRWVDLSSGFGCSSRRALPSRLRTPRAGRCSRNSGLRDLMRRRA